MRHDRIHTTLLALVPETRTVWWYDPDDTTRGLTDWLAGHWPAESGYSRFLPVTTRLRWKPDAGLALPADEADYCCSTALVLLVATLCWSLRAGHHPPTTVNALHAWMRGLISHSSGTPRPPDCR